MSFYSILEHTPINTDWVADYIAPTNAAIKRHGGVILARTANHERIEGEGDYAQVLIIIKWPTRESAMMFMNDPEYIPHYKQRIASSHTDHYLVEGKDDLV